MKKKAVFLSVLFFLCLSLVGAEEEKVQSILSEEEIKEEFPLWARDLRRGEIVLFGSLPFSLFFSKIAFDSFRWYDNNWDMRYAPWPLKGSDFIELTDAEAGYTVAIAFGLSTAIALADHFILRHKRKKEIEREAARGRSTLRVEELPPIEEEESNGLP